VRWVQLLELQPRPRGRPSGNDRQTGAAMSGQTAASTPAPKRRRRRTTRALGLGAILLAVLVVAAPRIVAHTGLHDDAIRASPSVVASSDSAPFGWFAPLSISAILLAVLVVAAP